MEQPETPRDVWRRWEADQAAAIVDSINQVRDARGISLRRLAELLDDAGWPISFGTLAGILSTKTRAGFTVAEVFAFARALTVPPGYLMLGLPDGGLPDRPVLPRGMQTGDLLLWFTGRGGVPGVDEGRTFLDPDEVTSNAIEALKDASVFAQLLNDARWQNDLLIAAQSLTASERAAVPVAVLEGVGLREVLGTMHDLLELNASEAGRLRPKLPVPPAPFDVVTRDPSTFDGLELPLPIPEGHDVSRARARLEDVVRANRLVRGSEPGGLHA
jgi:transcriptional regulator with XRE-family HTH domain